MTTRKRSASIRLASMRKSFALKPLALGVAWLSIVGTPRALTKIELISAEARREADLASIEPGRFTIVGPDRAVVYGESISPEGQMENVFLERQVAHDAPELAELRSVWQPPVEHVQYPTLYPPLSLALFSLSASAGVDAAPVVWKVLATLAVAASTPVSRAIVAFTSAKSRTPCAGPRGASGGDAGAAGEASTYTFSASPRRSKVRKNSSSVGPLSS